MAIFGIIYSIYPKAGETKLAKIHFWLHNIGVPVMQGSLFVMILTGGQQLLALAIISSLMVVVGVLLFTVNIFKIKANQSVASNKDVSL